MWHLDNGCNNHITGNKQLFHELDERKKTVITLGYNITIIPIGIDIIKVEIPKGRQNLLSLGQMMQSGYNILFEGGVCQIFNKFGSRMFSCSMTANKTFLVSFMSSSSCFYISDAEKSALWHKRFCHLNYDELKHISDIKVVGGLPSLTPRTRLCEACIAGKQHREKFEKGK